MFSSASSRLLKASEHGNVREVNALLERGASTLYKDSDGNSALHKAASRGHDRVVAILLSSGAPTESLDNCGCTALHYAAKYGHLGVVEKLLNKESLSIKVADNTGETPLHKAVYFGHTKVVQMLLYNGALTGSTSVHKAAYKGYDEIAEFLLNAGASVDITTKSKCSALHLAAMSGHTNVAQILLNAGACNDLRDKIHATPLHKAAASGHNAIVEILLKSGASIDAKDKKGRTALSLAKSKKKTSTVALLESYMLKNKESSQIGEMPNQSDHNNNSDKANALQQATPTTHTPNKIATNTSSNSSKPLWNVIEALEQAIQEGNVSALCEQLNKGANSNTINQEGNSLLHLAVAANQENIVDVLLGSVGIQLNVFNKQGLTPIVLAIKLGYRRLASQIYIAGRKSFLDVPSDDINIDFSKSLGSGGYGCVYQGSYKDEIVAIKTAHNGYEQALIQEISTMMKCRSPYIVDIVALSRQPNTTPKLALQFMDCGDLRRYLDAKRDGNSTNFTVTPLEVAWVVANALADLHHNGFIHRDLKSLNILLSTQHYIKLADMGISRESTQGTMTQVGTPLWEAPEVLRGEHYSYAADIYSFGVILTELDTLQLPYSGLGFNGINIMDRVQKGSLRPSLSPTCEPWLKSLAEKCLAFDAKQRPVALEIVDTLRYQLQNQSSSTQKQQRPPSSSGSAKSPGRDKIKNMQRRASAECTLS